jgi:hypothetical protein
LERDELNYWVRNVEKLPRNSYSGADWKTDWIYTGMKAGETAFPGAVNAENLCYHGLYEPNRVLSRP